MTAKEAKNKKVYLIEEGKIVETSLYDHVMGSQEEITSPRGVESKTFAEQAFDIPRAKKEYEKGKKLLESGKFEAEFNDLSFFETSDLNDEWNCPQFRLQGEFYEKSFKDLCEDGIDELYTVYEWCFGKRKQVSDYFTSEEKLNDYMFNWALADDNHTGHFDTLKEAQEVLNDRMSV